MAGLPLLWLVQEHRWVKGWEVLGGQQGRDVGCSDGECEQDPPSLRDGYGRLVVQAALEKESQTVTETTWAQAFPGLGVRSSVGELAPLAAMGQPEPSHCSVFGPMSVSAGCVLGPVGRL